jgi:disulfide bond formation protein DsbB
MKKYFYLSNFLLSSLALIIAYIIQIIGFLPCIICYYQRFIYILIIIVNLLGFFKDKKFLLPLHYLLLIFGIGLSIFQVAIEEKLILYKSNCTSDFQSVTSPTELLSEIYNKDLVPCDKPQIKFFGLFSLAALNLFYLFFLLGLNIILLYKEGSLIKRILNHVTSRR